MRKILASLSLITSLAFTSAFSAETPKDYLQAQKLISLGEAAEKSGNHALAAEKFGGARWLLRTVKEKQPSWEPQQVADRIEALTERIAKNGGLTQKSSTSAKTVKTSPTSKPAPEKRSAPATSRSVAEETPSAPSSYGTKALTQASQTPKNDTHLRAARREPTNRSEVKTAISSEDAERLSNDVGSLRDKLYRTQEQLEAMQRERQTHSEKYDGLKERYAAQAKELDEARSAQKEIESVEGQVRQLTRSNSKEIQALKAELESTQARLAEITSETPGEKNTPLSNEVRALKAKLQKTEEAMVTFQKERQSNQDQIEELKDSLLVKQEEAAKGPGSNQNIQGISRENEAIDAELKRVESEVKKALETSSKEIGTLKTDLHNAQVKLEDLQKENEDLRQIATSKPSSSDDQKISSENSSLKEALQRLETDFRGFQSTFEEAKSIKNDWAKTQAELESWKKENASHLSKGEVTQGTTPHAEDIESLFKDNENLKEKLTKLETGIDSIRASATEAKSFKDDLAKTREQLEALQKDNESLRTAVEAKSSASPQSQEELKALSNENENLKNKLASLQTELKSTSEGSKEVKSVQNELQKAQERLEELQKENEGLRAATDNAKDNPKSSDGDIEKLAKENQSLKGKVDDLEAKIKNAHSSSEDIQSAQGSIAKMEKEVDELRKENEGLRSAREEAKAHLSSSEKQLQEASNENQNLKEKVAKLEKNGNSDADSKDVENLKNDLSKSQEKLEALQKENESLKEASNQAGENLKASDKSLQKLSEENNALKEKLAKVENSSSNSGDMSSIKEDLEKTKGRLESLQQENSGLRSASDEATSAAKRSRKEFEELMDKHNSLKEQYARLEHKGEKREEAPKMVEEKREEPPVVKSEPVEAPKMVEEKPAPAPKPAPEEKAPEPKPAEVVSAPEPVPAPETPKPAAEPAPVKSEPASNVQPVSNNAAPAVSAKPVRIMGDIVTLNMSDKFAVINFSDGEVPPAGTELNVYRNGQIVGRVRISEPIKPPFGPVDVLSGSLVRGDQVGE
jgi:chromosome segregation ATPase